MSVRTYVAVDLCTRCETNQLGVNTAHNYTRSLPRQLRALLRPSRAIYQSCPSHMAFVPLFDTHCSLFPEVVTRGGSSTYILYLYTYNATLLTLMEKMLYFSWRSCFESEKTKGKHEKHSRTRATRLHMYVVYILCVFFQRRETKKETERQPNGCCCVLKRQTTCFECFSAKISNLRRFRSLGSLSRSRGCFGTLTACCCRRCL